jgi:hypothetical protein
MRHRRTVTYSPLPTMVMVTSTASTSKKDFRSGPPAREVYFPAPSKWVLIIE